MILDIQKITRNPVILGSSLLLFSAGLITLLSLGLLIDAFLYSPTAAVFNKQQSATAGPFNSEEISARNFFGLANSKPELIVDDLPETKLALILRGAFMGSDEKSAGAIIENEETRVANNYYIGESLPGDATLKAIYPDRVVLSRNGILETLYFPDISDNTGIGAIKQSDAGVAAGAADDEATRKRREAIRARIKQLRGNRR